MKLVVSTMKNEAPFLLEWLAYHQVIGFDAFLIYTNDCTDGTDFMLERLTELGHVRHVRNQVLRRGPHKSALKYAFEDPMVHQASWVYVTDADEFLNIKSGAGHVEDLVEAYPDADAIPVTWRLFSNSGQIEFPFGLCLETMTDAEPASGGNALRFVKSLFRPDPRLSKLGLHAPDYAEEKKDDIVWGSQFARKHPDGEPRRPSETYGYEIAQINHYAVRSVDSYLLKRDRGRANHVGETLSSEYWLRWNLGGDADLSIQRHLDAVKTRLSELRQDPELAFLERAAIALSRSRLAELKSDPEIAKLRDRLVKSNEDTASPVRLANARMRKQSPSRFNNRRAFLERMPKGACCAEIGVWQGSFTLEILEVTKPKELVLMDPWGLITKRDSAEWTHTRNEDQEFMERMYEDVVEEFRDSDVVKIRKGFSQDLMAEYPDAYFDWVYIDGNHRYDFVRADIELCALKVRKGGIISGDDFRWKRDGRMHVKDAVTDAMQALGLAPNRLSLQGQQFCITL
ncbi:MAG: glycosyltransferase family 2 protein [Pseudomonadota bacterium]